MPSPAWARNWTPMRKEKSRAAKRCNPRRIISIVRAPYRQDAGWNRGFSPARRSCEPRSEFVGKMRRRCSVATERAIAYESDKHHGSHISLTQESGPCGARQQEERPDGV